MCTYPTKRNALFTDWLNRNIERVRVEFQEREREPRAYMEFGQEMVLVKSCIDPHLYFHFPTRSYRPVPGGIYDVSSMD